MSCKQISHTYSKLYTLMFICAHYKRRYREFQQWICPFLFADLYFFSFRVAAFVCMVLFFLAVLFCNVSVCCVARCFSSSCQRSPHPSVSIVSTFTICTGNDNGSGIIHHSIAFGRKVSENYLNWWKYLLTFNDDNNMAGNVGDKLV